MTQQTINIGTASNDDTGDPLRTAFTKCNDNFTELYARATPQEGRLTYVSATALKFAPYNGNKIKINGAIYTIPNAGIAGLANTGAFVNGTGSSSLAANTVYWVYAFINSGTVTADFRSASTHAPSTTVGNEGVEIRTGDDSRTLIGLIATNASSQFLDTAQTRWVRSWFNPKPLTITGPSFSSTNTSTTTFAFIGGASNFVVWAGEAIDLTANCYGYLSVAGFLGASVYFNGAVVGPSEYFYSYGTGIYETGCPRYVVDAPGEGLYQFGAAAVVSTGTGTFWGTVTGMLGGRP